MPDRIQCPDCGAELPPGQPKGLCPRCALKGALDLSAATETVAPSLSDPTGTLAPSEGERAGVRGNFGDYELLEEIARGGMGIVFKARQRKLDRIVAVKMILAGEFASKEQALRFRVEAEAAARLQHPNIVRIHETGEQDGQPYFSMDYVEGGNLAALVREKPLPAMRAAGYVKTIAEAIHYAHEQGILHRDLKPSNVLIDHADQPRVTDFGLARNLANNSDLTVTGQVYGSPSFMPPEQASGQREKVGVTSDVYSLGAILYHALTGRPPFAGQSVAETLQQVENKEPIAPRLLNPIVPRDLETICLKCLQKEPGRRYSSAHELAEELCRFLRDEPIHARPASNPEKLWRWCQRKPAIAGMAAGIVVVSAIGLAGWLVAREKAAAAAGAMVAKGKADEDAARKTQQTEEILRANDEFLLRQVSKDTNNLRGPALLKALEVAISQQPAKLELWRAKMEVLTRANRLDDVLETLSRVIDLASTDANVPRKISIEMLLARARLLRQMGRTDEAGMSYSEAGRINCEENRIRDRDPQTRPEMLDLSPHFQSNLSSFLDILSTDGEAANTILEDVKRDTGVEFDLRGGLKVHAGTNSLLTEIPVHRRFQWLHALHSVWRNFGYNSKIAAYVLHYADDQTRELPILYGHHFRDIWCRDSQSPSDALLAWRGESNGADKACQGVQFFKATWENPRPEVEVRSIDLIVRPLVSYPILLGITVEEAGPGSPEFWTTKAKLLEGQGNVAEALNTHDQAIRQLPGIPALLDSKGGLFERAGRTNEALEAYTKAIEMAAGDTNAFLKVLKSALVGRSSLLDKMGRFDEAGMDNCRARSIPSRDPQTRPELLDLSRFYHSSLAQFLPSRERESTEMLSRVAQQNTGVAFDARGYFGVYGKGLEVDVGGTYQQSVLGIPINRRLTRLHILHASVYRSSAGTKIGSYVLNFADGPSETLPIIYGKDVTNDLEYRGSPIARAELAWPGSRTKLPIYKITWTNPHPEVEIKSLDFVSAMSETSPLLIAITVEP